MKSNHLSAISKIPEKIFYFAFKNPETRSTIKKFRLLLKENSNNLRRLSRISLCCVDDDDDDDGDDVAALDRKDEEFSMKSAYRFS